MRYHAWLRFLALTLVLSLSGVLPPPAAKAQNVQGQFSGTSNCYVNGKWVTVRGNCSTPSGGTGSRASGRGGGIRAYSNDVAAYQYQLMMAELARRRAEAERLRQEEEARQLAEMWNRLANLLIHRDLPNLQTKERGGGSGLQIKMRSDNSQGYGIPGLPGTYTGGPGPGSGMTPQNESKLQLKTRDGGDPNHAGIPDLPGLELNDGDQAYGIPGLPGIYVGGPGPGSGMAPQGEPGPKTQQGQSSTAPAGQADTFDPSKMTLQQLANVVEVLSNLPPEQQQIMDAVQHKPAVTPAGPGPSGQPTAAAPASLQPQAAASQSAAAAPVLEDASAKARAGFDQPLPSAVLELHLNSSTPALLSQPQPTAPSLRVAPPPPPMPSVANTQPAATTPKSPVSSKGSGTDQLLATLFPFTPPASGPFPSNPNPPLRNPLLDDQHVKAELKGWDKWANECFLHMSDAPADPLYPQATVRMDLNSSVIKQFAPELLVRYQTDAAFRQNLDQRIQFATESVGLDYYRSLAQAHKDAILALQAELEKLAAAGKIDRLVPLEEQYRLHPERRALVQTVQDTVNANGQAALEKASAEGNQRLDSAYNDLFRLIRDQAAPQP